jgi:hypothetical protein
MVPLLARTPLCSQFTEGISSCRCSGLGVVVLFVRLDLVKLLQPYFLLLVFICKFFLQA